MTRFSEKVIRARTIACMEQQGLADLIGVTRRSVFSYESGACLPRPAVLRKLANALDVTVEYLTIDDCDDPNQGRLREEKVGVVRTLFGSKGANEINELIDRNAALFAGGEFDQESKDAFFEAVMTAYITCKNEARIKFGRKSPEEST